MNEIVLLFIITHLDTFESIYGILFKVIDLNIAIKLVFDFNQIPFILKKNGNIE
ncbi:hypothetical protein Aocu_06550 [Acholeplasma oculi]|uniref:Uncharacterized protein n=1 Tax=Acholeplasma oculi TaxID=35623 RepID=A0A061AA74_9MOLU|nr:hypothetical protein Aocu_06550 [Acholeplasma oculi]